MENVEAIMGLEPMREGEFPSYYKVGYEGVTKIEYKMINYGDHGEGVFDIYKADVLVSSISVRAVGEIFYFHDGAE